MKDTSVLHIMYGLPGSGKTTLAMKLYENYDKNSYRVGYFCTDKQEDFRTFQNFPEYGIPTYKDTSCIIDGYSKSIEDLMKNYNVFRLRANFKLSSRVYRKTIIHNFIPNIEACIHNDSLRHRVIDARTTIEKGIEPFSLDRFIELASEQGYHWLNDNIEVINHVVDKYDSAIHSKYIYSRWHTDTDSIANIFPELDSYLEKNYPNCTFLQYKRIQKYIETIRESSRDYYDTEETKCFMYKIKISDIINILEGEK